MAKKKKEQKPKQKFVEFDGDLLHATDDEALLKRRKLYDRTILSRARYWCYRFRNEAEDGAEAIGAPEGFKVFIEALPGFLGWEFFAEKWDITGRNPFMVVYRIMSVWQEWEQVMERVAIPIDTPPSEIAARMRILEREYKG